MSKSTPLNEIKKNLQKEDNENNLVNEILKEIESNPAQPEKPNKEESLRNDVEPEQEPEPEKDLEQEKSSEEQVSEENLEEIESFTNNNQSFFGRLLSELKGPVIVFVICMIISIPFLNTKISNLLSAKESLQKHSSKLLVLIKGLFGAIIYYLTNKYI